MSYNSPEPHLYLNISNLCYLYLIYVSGICGSSSVQGMPTASPEMPGRIGNDGHHQSWLEIEGSTRNDRLYQSFFHFFHFLLHHLSDSELVRNMPQGTSALCSAVSTCVIGGVHSLLPRERQCYENTSATRTRARQCLTRKRLILRFWFESFQFCPAFLVMPAGISGDASHFQFSVSFPILPGISGNAVGIPWTEGFPQMPLIYIKC